MTKKRRGLMSVQVQEYKMQLQGKKEYYFKETHEHQAPQQRWKWGN